MEEQTAIQKMDNQIIGITLSSVYEWRIENPGESLNAACEALDLPYRTVAKWINDGKFTEYLEEIKDPRSQLAQSKALNALPGIVDRMAQVALGNLTLRGQSPGRAAEFVLRVAQIGAKQEGNTPKSVTLIHAYMPGMGNTGESQEGPRQQVIEVEATPV